jgi:hypothetical protein
MSASVKQWSEHNAPGQLRDAIAESCTQALDQTKKATSELGCSW